MEPELVAAHCSVGGGAYRGALTGGGAVVRGG
jgi:hypothetical protein